MAGTWTNVTIGNHPADVFTPTGAARARFALIFLHGVGQETLKESAVYTRLFEELQLPCISPVTKYSFWNDKPYPEFDSRITAEKYVLTDVLGYAAQTWGVKPPAVGLFGISMGGQGALRLGFKYPRIFPVVAGVSSAIEYHEHYGQGWSMDQMYDSKEQCRQDTAPMHVHPSEHPPHVFFCIDPTDYPWFRGNDRLHEKLRALGVAHEVDLTTQAGGHTWAYFEAMGERTVRFLHDGLVAQSRRLL